MSQDIITQLKEQFRDFCGLLSVNEITNNAPLMRVLERFERMLNEIRPDVVRGKT